MINAPQSLLWRLCLVLIVASVMFAATLAECAPGAYRADAKQP